MNILEALTATPQNKRVLAEKLRTTTREIELAIQAARLEGHAIISCSEGYYLSQDPNEIRKCAQRLRSRAMTQLTTAQALNRAADEMPLTLFGDAATGTGRYLNLNRTYLSEETA